MSKKITTGFITSKINGITVNKNYPAHSSNYTNSSSRTVSHIIIHYSGNSKDTGLANCKYFQTANRKASAHFFVDNTAIYQSVELRDSAWSIGCSQGYKTSARNTNTINIEMCCTAGNYLVSETTQINAAYLCAEMCKLVGITANTVDTYVLRHYDCVKSNKQCPKQYVTNPAQWTQFKTWVKNILNTGSHLGASTPTSSSYVINGVDYSPVFDPTYYSNKYSDLKGAFGTNATLLFNHFINNGMKEMRQASAKFNVQAYATRYADLRNAFGALTANNAVLYYNHYCTNGLKEGRNGV